MDSPKNTVELAADDYCGVEGPQYARRPSDG
jgi:hypothetical protein